jgi:hypothetical protein
MADSNRNADLNPTTSAAEYFGLHATASSSAVRFKNHPDLSLTAGEEAAIMLGVVAPMNRWDTISPKVGTQTSTLTKNNCREHNFHRFTDRCLTRGLQIRFPHFQLPLLQLRCMWS